eukprot:CAMPEP_0202703748 /NCGR_PEP_ID=MMETSP1385-20130828/16558_1 /ASSEMBLY_ACC=CAM_ASM_000861 /TAXON_ID=933848 /ORGANISM="Elphidium margaritaceum" /LENGTH=187 /DNA_ID=CAMNT_0049361651 /DNA_START=18 /DNA_END=577 /DNA_ORIENTATION=-
MSRSKSLESELKRIEASYIELLHTTSIEIERLKCVIRILVCVEKNKEIPQSVKDKMTEYETMLHHHTSRGNNNNTVTSNVDVDTADLYHDAMTGHDHHDQVVNDSKQADDEFELISLEKQIEVLQESKVTLIKSSSFEIDRLRTVITYLDSKIVKEHSAEYEKYRQGLIRKHVHSASSSSASDSTTP